MLTTVHAAAVLVFVEALIRSVPLPRLSEMLGIRVNLAPPPAGVERLPAETLTPRDRRQLRCSQRVADVWPLSKGPCLRRSLVAGHLLRRHHPAVRLGVSGTGDRLLAHAWLEIDDRPLEDVAHFSAFHVQTTETVVRQ